MVWKIYGVLLGYIFLNSNLAETNSKLMMICGSIPNFFVLVGSQMVLAESPRLPMANKRFDEGF